MTQERQGHGPFHTLPTHEQRAKALYLRAHEGVLQEFEQTYLQRFPFLKESTVSDIFYCVNGQGKEESHPDVAALINRDYLFTYGPRLETEGHQYTNFEELYPNVLEAYIEVLFIEDEQERYSTFCEWFRTAEITKRERLEEWKNSLKQ